MKKALGASIGHCVHVAGIINFLETAKSENFDIKFCGPATSVDKLINDIKDFNPDIAGISYRLSPESAVPVFTELSEKLNAFMQRRTDKKKIVFVLGTTKPVAQLLKTKGLLDYFEKIFTGGEDIVTIRDFITGKKEEGKNNVMPPQSLVERIAYKKPLPLFRHHYGRPDFNETIRGIKKISESGLIDVVSLGPDQNTQEFFFEPEKRNKDQDGAGGVPIRSEEDFKKLFNATRTGNYPIMRCYSGTKDIIRFAEVLRKTINNAWCAVPLFWYNEIDGRSERKLEDSILENQQVMNWHAQRNIPVEVNESHHWSLRYAHDSVAVAAAYLAAYNAKKQGVTTYVSQYMFNTPPETSFKMDLAKMLAKLEMIESLHDKNFTSIRESRSGLYSMSGNFNANKAQLVSSTMLQMQIDPQIVHVVAFCESEYAAKPDDIIESCELCLKAVENHLNGSPDMKKDESVIQRKNELVKEAGLIISAIKKIKGEKKYEDNLTSPEILAKAVKTGIIDAPHLRAVSSELGRVVTKFYNGANYAVDSNFNILTEKERLEGLLRNA